MNALWIALGVLLGVGVGLAFDRAPQWFAQHPGTVLLSLLGAAMLALLMVRRRMHAYERGHDERAEAFRLAMLEQYAPELAAARR
jgi:putative Mn2+ efflux pump MntP